MHTVRRGLVLAALLAAVAIPVGPAARAAAPAMPMDFNGDGYADLAIGVPMHDVWVGEVVVLHGGPTGLTASGSQRWSQATPGIAGSATERAEFGSSVASGDIDGDGYADLAIGAPRAWIPDQGVSGAVTVLYGGAGRAVRDGQPAPPQRCDSRPEPSRRPGRRGHRGRP